MRRRKRHKSVDKSLKGPIEKLENQPGVTKVVLGPYMSKHQNQGHGHPAGTLRYHNDIRAGVRLTAYSGRGIRELFVYVEPDGREPLKEYLKQEYSL